jgi:hypothetical protein
MIYKPVSHTHSDFYPLTQGFINYSATFTLTPALLHSNLNFTNLSYSVPTFFHVMPCAQLLRLVKDDLG